MGLDSYSGKNLEQRAKDNGRAMDMQWIKENEFNDMLFEDSSLLSNSKDDVFKFERFYDESEPIELSSKANRADKAKANSDANSVKASQLLADLAEAISRTQSEPVYDTNSNLSPQQPENKPSELDKSSTITPDIDAIIAAMEKGTIDVNGNPIVDNQESMDNARRMGFAKVWILGILTALVSFGIIILNIIINQ